MSEIDRMSRRTLSRRVFKHRIGVRNAVILGVVSFSGLALLGFAVFGPSLRPEDERHLHFAAALWPGSRFESEPAVLYRDPAHPLTWHVCTATGCGRYFEDQGDAEKSK
jgi:hypothetical protein